VSGDAQIRQNAYVEGDSWPHYNCVITGNAVVRDSRISDNVWVTGDAIVVKCGLHPILY